MSKPRRQSSTSLRRGTLAVALVSSLGLAACSSSKPSSSEAPPKITSDTTSLNAADTTTPAPSTDDVFTTAAASGRYPTFVRLVEKAGLADALKTGAPLTVAIPTEDAFAKVPKDQLAALEADTAELARVLKYHVVPALVNPDPAASGPVETLEGSTINVVFTATSATINDATILTSPQVTANGAYVAIDSVLFPPKS
jgi:uncharacterized surface protein with fasciclin (FAS1) repeats